MTTDAAIPTIHRMELRYKVRKILRDLCMLLVLPTTVLSVNCDAVTLLTTSTDTDEDTTRFSRFACNRQLTEILRSLTEVNQKEDRTLLQLILCL